MEQTEKKENSTESLFAAWTKSAADLWGNLAKMQTGMAGAFASSEKTPKDPAFKAQKAAETGFKFLQMLLAKFSEPENLTAALKGIESLPEFLMNMGMQNWDSYLEMQKKWADMAAKMGQHTEAYTFKDIDQNIFKIWRDIYEKEIQKFLNVPQLGLTRFQQERATRMVDKFNIYQAALNEFLYMFYIPVEKSSAVMQEKIGELIEKGEIHDNFKEYYNMWIKTLEGHYMTLLKSPEYTQVMNNAIDALTQYRKAKEEMLYDLLQDIPVPTNKEMDELYKEFYLLKKKVRELSRKLEGKQGDAEIRSE